MSGVSSATSTSTEPGIKPQFNPKDNWLTAPTVFVHKTVLKRHKKNSRFSYFAGTFDELIILVRQKFDNGTQGELPDTLVISVPPQNFFTRISSRDLQDRALKPTAKSVYIVLWSREKILAENKKNLPEGEWGIVSINASLREPTLP